jgi:hypothetical protein
MINRQPAMISRQPSFLHVMNFEESAGCLSPARR